MVIIIWFWACAVGTVYSVTDSRSGLGLSAFPTDVNADVTILRLTTNSLTNIPPEALLGLPVLRYLGLGENLLTSFPNLTAVASSLEQLYAYENDIVVVDVALLEALYKLRKLSLQLNDLVSFPTVTSGACHSLTYLNLADNPIATTPSFEHYTALVELRLQGTYIAQVPTFGTVSISVTSALQLEETLITEIPVQVMSSMTSLKSLKLTDSSVVSLPSPCIELSMVGSLVLWLKSTALPLCQCRHIWLKVAVGLGADVRFDDADCWGYFWSITTVQDLLNACSQAMPGVATVHAKRLSRGFFCPFPIHSMLHGIPLVDCLSVCHLTPGCFSFNFRRVDRRHGQCVILAPGNHLDLQVPDTANTAWNYYVII